MTEPMDSQRLRRLIETYGAAPGRWPASERAAAAEALASLPEADADLRAARDLDALLDAWRLEPPAQALADCVVAHAVAQRGPVGRRAISGRAGPGGGVTGRAAAWIAGAGLAAACAAGVLAGVGLGDLDGPRAGDAEAAGGLLDGATAFGVPTELEKNG